MPKSNRLRVVFNAFAPKVATPLFDFANRFAPIRAFIQNEIQKMLSETGTPSTRYAGELERFRVLPKTGRERRAILQEMRKLRDRETVRWQQGFVSGAVYHGDNAHIDFLNEVYSMYSQTNPLHSDLWPSAVKYEAEIIAMTADMLGAGNTGDAQARVCGSLSSGGTESILLAMKTYRDFARSARGVRRPEMVIPVTAHAAFDKASQYFGIKMRKIPVGLDSRADVRAAQGAINRNTVVVVGSAPSFPHGAIDPIAELSELARARGVGFHTDACLGGFVLPWAEKLGYPVPRFDFRLPGVTSISADTHKYGYAAKGTSVILYRTPELRRFQYYTATEWPGGLYFSPTLAGSRPGGLSASCWAALLSMGEEGYLDATRRILETAAQIKNAVRSIPDLRIIGDPLWVLALASDTLDIYKIMDAMSERGWNLNGLQKPPAVHLCITLRHTQEGVAQRFIADLIAAVAEVRADPKRSGGMAPVYGMAGTLPARSAVREVLRALMDRLYEV
jgi:glutamate/tyrosine decarboxylase-like PLP-dependent enzyme